MMRLLLTCMLASGAVTGWTLMKRQQENFPFVGAERRQTDVKHSSN